MQTKAMKCDKANKPRQNIAGGLVRVVSLVCADVLCICSVWAVTVYSYKLIWHARYNPERYIEFWPITVVFVLFNMIFRLYHGNCFYPSMPLGEVEEFRRLVVSSLITHLLAMAFLGFSRQVEIVSRVVLIISSIGVAVLSQPFRNGVRRILWRMGIGRLPAFLIGSGPLAQQIADLCAASPFFGYRIVGSFDHRGEKVNGVPRLGSLRDIVSCGRDMRITRLVVCEDERLLSEQLLDFTSQFQFIDFFPSRKAFPVFGSRLIEMDGFCGVEMVNQACMKILGQTIELAAMGKGRMIYREQMSKLCCEAVADMRNQFLRRCQERKYQKKDLIVYEFDTLFVVAPAWWLLSTSEAPEIHVTNY